MKKLWMLRYWLVTLLGAVSLICLVAYHQHEISEQYRGHRATYCAAFSKTTVEEAACIEERESAKDYQKWWFVLVSWPEGISTWAIIATGAFIAWQSWETRKSPEASGKQIGLQRKSLRPRIGVGNLVKDAFAEAFNGEWVTVNIKLFNGGMPAYNVVIDTWIEFISGVPP